MLSKLQTPLTILLATACSSCLAADEGGDLLEEYSKSLSILVERFDTFSATAVHNRIDHTAKVNYFVQGDAFQSRQQYANDPSERPPRYPLVRLRSEDGPVKFELSKQEVSSDFILTGFGAGKKTELSRYHRRYNKPIALAATHIFDVSISELLNDQESSLISGNRILTDSGEEAVEFVFQLGEQLSSFQKARITVVPGRDWVLESYMLEFSNPQSAPGSVAKYIARIQYHQPEGLDFEVPKVIKIEVDEGAKPPVPVIDASIDYDFLTTIPPDQFTLKAFGLAPQIHEGSRATYWLWVVFGIVAATGFFMWYRGQRIS